MLKRILKVGGFALVAIAVVGVALYLLGMRIILDGGGMPSLAFVQSTDAQAEVIARHGAQYLNVTEAWWDGACALEEQVRSVLGDVALHHPELAGFVPSLLMDLRGPAADVTTDQVAVVLFHVDRAHHVAGEDARRETGRLLLDLGLDPNAANKDGRTAIMGAALKGRNDVIQLLVDRGAKIDARDKGSRDTGNAASAIAGCIVDPRREG